MTALVRQRTLQCIEQPLHVRCTDRRALLQSPQVRPFGLHHDGFTFGKSLFVQCFDRGKSLGGLPCGERRIAFPALQQTGDAEGQVAAGGGDGSRQGREDTTLSPVAAVELFLNLTDDAADFIDYDLWEGALRSHRCL